MEVVRGFARRDAGTVAGFEKLEFAHVGDPALRTTLAATLYGARWIYGLSKATLVDGMERSAHIRTQLIDYAAIVEALLGESLRHAVIKGYLQGQAHRFKDPPKNAQTTALLTPTNVDDVLPKRSFYWYIAVASDEAIIDDDLRRDAQWLRGTRNAVHLFEKAKTGGDYYLRSSRRAWRVVNQTVAATKAWRITHP
jgi:hypothetical protein